jgi:hypothetical protein
VGVARTRNDPEPEPPPQRLRISGIIHHIATQLTQAAVVNEMNIPSVNIPPINDIPAHNTGIEPGAVSTLPMPISHPIPAVPLHKQRLTMIRLLNAA